MRSERSDRRAVVAWSICAASLALTGIGVALGVSTWSVPAPPGLTPRGFVLVLGPLFAIVGALICARGSGNAIGYVFLYMGAGSAVQLVSEQIAFASVVWPALAPIAPWAGTLFLGLGQLNSFMTALYVTALFPRGAFETKPERRAVIIGTVAFAVLAALNVLTVDPLPEPFSKVSPPFARLELTPALYVLGVVGLVMYLTALAYVARELMGRFVRSRGIERQQFKWFAYAAALLLGTSVVLWSAMFILGFSFGIPYVVRYPPAELRSLIALNIAAYAAVPLAIGFAILRYRLYDIDVLINRTLVYGAVSAALGAIYVVAIVVLQGILRPIAGPSEFAVALSTLLVVALFQPIRAQAQNFVDRRFYRARYDAARTIDAFSVRLRDDVELDSVRADLMRVLDETIQPAHASVWLRDAR